MQQQWQEGSNSHSCNLGRWEEYHILLVRGVYMG
jgi:hypothetical protein